MSDYNIKKYSDLTIVDSLSDGDTVLAVDSAGKLKRTTGVKGGGGDSKPFYIYIPTYCTMALDLPIGNTPYMFACLYPKILTQDKYAYFTSLEDLAQYTNGHSIDELLALGLNATGIELIFVEMIPQNWDESSKTSWDDYQDVDFIPQIEPNSLRPYSDFDEDYVSAITVSLPGSESKEEILAIQLNPYRSDDELNFIVPWAIVEQQILPMYDANTGE